MYGLCRKLVVETRILPGNYPLGESRAICRFAILMLYSALGYMCWIVEELKMRGGGDRASGHVHVTIEMGSGRECKSGRK